ncbi:LAFE_0H05468g1_1 [Lachancea fermentati]|uniref:LAFE_0H05468g1_1 n=1 Tax=Lachancea fermentati TaxID=4955 RepID=A0A1G4MJM4_LACFM|nr:LAFE_0H05468g1_1 [Lachancea fermentati]
MSVGEVKQPGAIKSLDELPLNVIFRILFFLDFDALNKVSKTCRALKILCNESITYNRALKEQTSANWWTKRLLFDVFHVMDTERNLLKYVSTERISIIGSLRAVQESFDLGSDQLLIECSQRISTKPIQEFNEFSEGDNIDDDILPASGTEYSGNDYNGLREDINRPLDRDGLAYLKILQGFHRIAVNSHKLFHRSSESVLAEQCADQNSENVETPTKPAKTVNVALTPIESFQSLVTSEEKSPECLQFTSDSPESSNRSRSASSVFSDPPKLSERAWSFGYELDHISDEHSESDSSSSTEFIRQLQNSSKVSDKKFLFERLMAKKREEEALITRSNKSNTYESLRPISNPKQIEGTRSVSQGYLMELERCDSPINKSHLSTAKTIEPPSKEFLVRYQDHVANKVDEKSEKTDRKREAKKASRAPYRRKLKALVIEGNRVCYEKI